ncbi:MAG: hypothetical protein ABJA94_03280, partial [Rhodoglobus sp.]
MPTEDDLRDLFASSDSPRGIDTKHVIARSRARRLPRQLAAGAIGTLAVVGIAVVGIQSILPSQSASTTSQAGGAAPSAADQSAASGQEFSDKRAPADKINLCTGAVAEPAPSFYGLQLSVEFPPTAPNGTTPIEGMVRLTNTGSEPVTGTAAAPAITLSQGGIVLWHSTGQATEIATPVDLAPGQWLEYPASLTPVRCDVQDDEGESFRADLPAVGPGEYDVSAAL